MFVRWPSLAEWKVGVSGVLGHAFGRYLREPFLQLLQAASSHVRPALAQCVRFVCARMREVLRVPLHPFPWWLNVAVLHVCG